MEHVPYPTKRCPACDYSTDALTYYGECGVSNYLVCIDERVIDGRRNPMCGQPTDPGFGCYRFESL